VTLGDTSAVTLKKMYSCVSDQKNVSYCLGDTLTPVSILRVLWEKNDIVKMTL